MFRLFFLTLFISLVSAGKYSHYPPVPKTYVINGFADDIYDSLPMCARECVSSDTLPSECPRWDTGCLCVREPFPSQVAVCIARNCRGTDAKNSRDLALQNCKRVGVEPPHWKIGDIAKNALDGAIASGDA